MSTLWLNPWRMSTLLQYCPNADRTYHDDTRHTGYVFGITPYELRFTDIISPT